MEQLQQLIEISRYYGTDKQYVIAGGGNTSYKNEEFIWVKSSGTPLADMTESGLAVLDRKLLKRISDQKYSEDIQCREDEVKRDLEAASINKERRPSVETSIHDIIDYAFVVHLHPTIINGLLCSINAEDEVRRLFGDKVIYVPYTDPGYTLFCTIQAGLTDFRERYCKDPQVIMLQNHGIFVAADNTRRIKEIYAEVISKINSEISFSNDTFLQLKFDTLITNALNEFCAARELFYTLKNGNLIQRVFSQDGGVASVSRPFIPDQIVYCKSDYLFLNDCNKKDILLQLESKYEKFYQANQYYPKVIMIKDIGLVALGTTAKEAGTVADVFYDAIRIADIAKNFGGAHHMTDDQIRFIENWEVENYRRKVAHK